MWLVEILRQAQYTNRGVNVVCFFGGRPAKAGEKADSTIFIG